MFYISKPFVNTRSSYVNAFIILRSVDAVHKAQHSELTGCCAGIIRVPGFCRRGGQAVYQAEKLDETNIIDTDLDHVREVHLNCNDVTYSPAPINFAMS